MCEVLKSSLIQYSQCGQALPVVWMKGVSIEYGHQLRHLDPDGTKNLMEAFGHLIAVKGVHASCMFVCMCARARMCVCVCGRGAITLLC